MAKKEESVASDPVLSRINAHLRGLGMDTLEEMRKLPRKPGKATMYDQTIRERFDRLVRNVEVLARELIESEERADDREKRRDSLYTRVRELRASLGHAPGAVELMWLVASVLRGYGDRPVVYCLEEEFGHPYAMDSCTGQLYSFNFACGVIVEYRPWKHADQMGVTIGGKASERFTVDADGTVSPKEEGALVGFLLRHGIKAEFPLPPPAQPSPMSPEAAALLTSLGIDPHRATTRQHGDSILLVVDM